jgi:hypothetical protein
MRHRYASLLPVAALISLACTSKAQNENSRQVAGGGISVPGWSGQIDPGEAKRGQLLTNAKLAKEGNALHVTTGPAVAYWSPANTASGDYTVKASFTEPKYMNLNDHPHPYGIFIGGNDMGTANQSYFYCAAYGNGSFIARGFGPAPFQLNGGQRSRRGSQGSGRGAPVTQDIAVSVKGDKVSCAINGTVVGTYDKSAVVGTGSSSRPMASTEFASLITPRGLSAVSR